MPPLTPTRALSLPFTAYIRSLNLIPAEEISDHRLSY
jgi:hypothetical protein